jgi:DNA replication protein DnaC
MSDRSEKSVSLSQIERGSGTSLTAAELERKKAVATWRGEIDEYGRPGSSCGLKWKCHRECGKTDRIPVRYRDAFLLDLAGPTPSYDAAVNALLTLDGKTKWSDLPQNPGGIVCLVGPRGTGKTHLACATLNYLNAWSSNLTGEIFCNVQRRRYRPWGEYWRALDMFTAIKASFGGKGISGWEQPNQKEIIARWTNAACLVIDETQVRSDTAWEDSIITNLVDQRYADLRPTILISNLTVDAFMRSIGDSIESRVIEDGQIVVADWPSFRDAAAERRMAAQ